jgi:hypothetical protein
MAETQMAKFDVGSVEKSRVPTVIQDAHQVCDSE